VFGMFCVSLKKKDTTHSEKNCAERDTRQQRLQAPDLYNDRKRRLQIFIKALTSVQVEHLFC